MLNCTVSRKERNYVDGSSLKFGFEGYAGTSACRKRMNMVRSMEAVSSSEYTIVSY
jgi:hypothetical protein